MIFSTIALGARVCEQPDYHIVDRIQPHAVLVVADRVDLTLVHASVNAGQIFGRTAQALIGTALRELVDPPSLDRIRAVAASGENLQPQVLDDIRPFALSARGPLDAWIYPSGDKLCLEFMLARADRAQPELAEFAFARMLRAVCTFQGTEEALASKACAAIAALTGFDRVYLCEFDAEGHGHVPAEALQGHFPSLLHHHFPATDLPRKVRQLYVANRFRLIADSDATPIAVLARPGAETQLDLGASSCREIGATHLDYLRNMGAVASTSFSVVVDGRLAAMLGAHHHASRQLSYRQLLRCSQIADSFADRVTVLRLRAREERLHAKHALVLDAAEAFGAGGCRLPAFAAAAAPLLRTLFEADDVIARDGDTIHPGGLDPADAAMLLAWCAARLKAGDLVSTHNLCHEHPEFSGMRAQASGVLGFALDRDAQAIIVLLKREISVDRRWAGDPRSAVLATGSGALQPRLSFDTYRERVVGTAPPWSAECGELASTLRFACNQALVAEHLRTAAVKQRRLLSIANHEFRTPLGLIDSAMQRLAAQPEGANPVVHKYVGNVRKAVARMIDLINRTLANARVEEARIEIKPEPVELKRLIAEIAASQREITPDFEIALDAPEDDLVVEADRDMLLQVFNNLLSNAVKYSGASRRVDVHLAREGDAVRIAVRDHGVGVPADEVPKLFSRFFRARTAAGLPGTGIGLHLVSELVLLHGGAVIAESELDHGSTFTVTLPRQQHGANATTLRRIA